jgi:hypothetical protein
MPVVEPNEDSLATDGSPRDLGWTRRAVADVAAKRLTQPNLTNGEGPERAPFDRNDLRPRAVEPVEGTSLDRHALVDNRDAALTDISGHDGAKQEAISQGIKQAAGAEISRSGTEQSKTYADRQHV